ncbi:MAG: hypothetical protein ACO3DP_01300 [Candidatus Nanopelagicaceae bacterium]
MTTLSKEEKTQLINSRLNGLEFRKYGLDLDLIVENAKVSPDQDAISVINNSISELETQISALNTELAVVNSVSE